MKKFTKTLLIGSVLAAGSSAFGAASFTAGHADGIALGYEGGAFDPHFHHDDNAVIDGMVTGVEGEFAPDEIVTVVSQTTFDYVQDVVGGRPADPAWSLIGVDAGVSFWFLPQSDSGPGGAAALGVPFAGIGFEELDPADWVGDITLQLLFVDGPGEFSLYQTDISGPTFFLSSADGIGIEDSFQMSPGAHEHYNWGFTAAGDYEISVGFSGEHVTDGFQVSAATYSFSVVPEPSTALLGGLSLLALAARRRR